MDRMEQIAEAIHDGWWAYKLNIGYTLGPRGDDPCRTHPHMVPWAQLDDEAKNQDRFIAALILCQWKLSLENGDFKPVTPEDIHENWCAWEKAHNSKHPHNKPFKTAHPSGYADHTWQAERVNALLGRWKK